MRPRGDIRQAMAEAAERHWAEAQRGATWRDLAARAQVGWARARQTVRNMESAGELQRAGSIPVPGARRPMVAYIPAQRASPGPDVTLDAVLRSWA